ncbi:hypothetical protein AVEN_70103-1, partial [Araneus ventricosus]
PPSEAIVDASGTIEFEPNEIAEIRSAHSDSNQDLTSVRINQEPEQTIPVGQGIQVKEDQRITLTTNGPVKIIYRYRVTHPPNTAYRENEMIESSRKSFGNAFLLKRKDFTQKLINFPFYEMDESTSKFLEN